ncbi:MAG: XylR family transcriptional regulator [Planctomycetia bacterium]|nr:XylR family transcriptional regulator [Planctomycetia bacterium]
MREGSASPLPYIGLFMDLAYEHNRQKLLGIHQYEREHGPWRIHLEVTGTFDFPFQQFLEQGGDGIILSRYIPPEKRSLLAQYPLPIVQIGRLEEDPFLDQLDNVQCDHHSIGKMAADHFLERGFEHFAFVSDTNGWLCSPQRQSAYEERLREEGFSCHNYRNETTSPSLPGLGEKSLLQWLKNLPKPVGLFVSYDLRARQILYICDESGIHVPQEIAVLSVDNDELICSLTRPTLTSIDPHCERGGYLAAEQLHRRLRQKKAAPQTILYSPLGVIPRQSTHILLHPDPSLRLALEFIWNHVGNVSVAATAKHCRISIRKLEILFQSVLKKTVLEEIRETRFKEVLRLLQQPHLTLQQIAERCGLSSASNLNQQFRKKFGISMHQFRQSTLSYRYLPKKAASGRKR